MKEFAEDNWEHVLKTALDAVMNKVEQANDDSVEDFDFTQFDKSGFSSVAANSFSDASALEKAQAWVDFASEFDPTGWVAAASTFMHPMCDEWCSSDDLAEDEEEEEEEEDEDDEDDGKTKKECNIEQHGSRKIIVIRCDGRKVGNWPMSRTDSIRTAFSKCTRRVKSETC